MEELHRFLEKEVGSTDVFCLQETEDNFRENFAGLFSEFTGIHEYRFGFRDGDKIEDYALTTYVKKTLEIGKTEILFDELQPDDRVMGLGIDTQLNIEGSLIHILNYHGVSRPKDKLDTPERLNQSQKIMSHYAKIGGPRILIGDFNFLPSTQSYESIRGGEYRELVIDNGIPTTRNELYWSQRGLDHKYSDYCFVSPEIYAESFLVPSIQVSDHLPLILEFSLAAPPNRI